MKLTPELQREGAFYTPDIWVTKAHHVIEIILGKYWKDNYMVWDPAWGTGALTKNYTFKNLYASTLHQQDINNNINPEATKFQFDFLNDPFEKLPEKLFISIQQGNEILFLLNPPYATSNMYGSNSKKNVANTYINSVMNKKGWGACRQQLYAQFLYRIWTLNNVKIAIFAPPLYKSGSSFKKFRQHFYNKFVYKEGILFNASNFKNTSASWGVDFSLWIQGRENRDTLPIDVIGDPVITSKTIYNVDNVESLSTWVRKDTKKTITVDTPKVKSALNVTDKGINVDATALGYLHNNANNVYYNPHMVGLYSAPFASGHGVQVNADNIFKIVAVFTARKCVKSTWINQKDEYMAPNTEHPDYAQWNNDAVVYALFNNSSQQSSLRNIQYKGKLWNIENEFFWMSNDKIISIAEDSIKEDAITFTNDRLIYNTLLSITLSNDASTLVSMASYLIASTIKGRHALHIKNPRYHLNAWDAGWYQIKFIGNYLKLDIINDFNKLYTEFENRMREGVYKFGFLK